MTYVDYLLFIELPIFIVVLTFILIKFRYILKRFSPVRRNKTSYNNKATNKRNMQRIRKLYNKGYTFGRKLAKLETKTNKYAQAVVAKGKIEEDDLVSFDLGVRYGYWDCSPSEKDTTQTLSYKPSTEKENSVSFDNPYCHGSDYFDELESDYEEQDQEEQSSYWDEQDSNNDAFIRNKPVYFNEAEDDDYDDELGEPIHCSPCNPCKYCVDKHNTELDEGYDNSKEPAKEQEESRNQTSFSFAHFLKGAIDELITELREITNNNEEEVPELDYDEEEVEEAPTDLVFDFICKLFK